MKLHQYRPLFIHHSVFQAGGKARGAIAFALNFSLFLSFVSRQKKESKRLEKYFANADTNR
jgi:hypothetical protein